MIDPRKLLAKPGHAPAWGQTAAPHYVGAKPPVDDSPDLERILALPRRPPPEGIDALALVALMTERFAKPTPTAFVASCRCAEIVKARGQPPRPCIRELRLAQAWALYEIGLSKGLLAPIGVGHGKTTLDILAPLALGLSPNQSAVLLIPPTLVDQLVKEYELIAQHFRVPALKVQVPGYPEIPKPGVPWLVVLPYSRLSRPESTALLEALRPAAIIADECQKLRHAGAATTARVCRYMEAHPETMFLGWTGSLTDSSVRDYAHLACFSLGNQSPVPIDPVVVEDWARALDSQDWPAPPGALLKLCNPGEHYREGFQRRFLETQGIVSTSTAAVDAELEIVERKAPPIPKAITEAMDSVRATWVRPDGEELVEALSVARCLHELAAGFFYRWIFPRGESPSLIAEWLEARKDWHKEIRGVIVSAQEHLDSKFLVTCAAMRAHGDLPEADGLPAWKARHWPRWRDIKEKVQPETQAVRIDDYLARDAAKWAVDNLGIVWYFHRAFGEWVGEISGLPVHGGGPDAGAKIGAETGDRSVIASIKSHGTGRDGLQRIFWQQLIANPPSKNEDWEQCLDSQTEILTDRGWLGIGASWGDAKAAAYSLDGSLKWQPATRVERALGQEKMFGIANPHLDIRVTAGHRMIAEPSVNHTGNPEYDPARFYAASELPRTCRIPVAGSQVRPGLPLTDDELTFIGLFLTDGSLDPSVNSIRIFQSERYPEVISCIRRVLSGCGFKYNERVDIKPSNFGPRSPLHIWQIAKGSWGRLEPWLVKDMPAKVWEDISCEQLKVLLHGMWLGDGSKTPGTYSYDRYKNHTVNIATRRANVADTIQSLCVRSGFRCSYSKTKKELYMLHISEDRTWTVKRGASDTRPVWAEVPSDPTERVWCVSVPSGAIVTRRNGKVAIVGNCLGRLHRIGQSSPVVRAEFYRHTPELKTHVDRALDRALYVYQTTNAVQKISVGFKQG